MNRRIPAGTYGGVRGWRYELFRILLYSIVIYNFQNHHLMLFSHALGQLPEQAPFPLFLKNTW